MTARPASGLLMELALIDAIGPFFRGLRRRRINWSKIPFAHLAAGGEGHAEQWAEIRRELDVFAARVAALGYNAVTLDDVAHLADHAWYEPEVRARLAAWRAEFRELFRLLRARGLRVFVTSDYLTTTAAVDARLGGCATAERAWYAELVAGFLDDFPEVAGVVLRIGESDGRDVVDPLRSRLAVRRVSDVRALLAALLPVFETRGRRLVFRTWTVGAYLIGDLIWHRGRLVQVFAGIASPALVVSMKYGESDFFRYLPLNRQFFRIAQPKLVEFQARPEYEGAGEYPSFLGWECERHARELRAAPNVIGFSVWCQTGGWHAFRRRAFLEPEARWIELNAAVIPRIVRDGWAVERAVAEHFGADRAAAALEFLRRADLVVRELLYVAEFARQKLFFRRVRIPPLLHVYWDCIFVNDAARSVLRHFVRDPAAALRQGEEALAQFPELRRLADELGLPGEDVDFMHDTFRVIALARRYCFAPPDPALETEILATKTAYKARWPRSGRQRYRVRASFEPLQVRGRTLRWLLAVLVRRRRGYRTVLDHLITLRVLSWTYRLFRARHERALPKFARKSAMGIDAVLR